MADPSPTHWSVRILTTDYLVDGLLEQKSYSTRLSVFGYSEDTDPMPVWLHSARFQETHSAAAPISTVDKAAAVYYQRMIAMIPNDNPSLESALKQNSSMSHALPCELRSGAYRIRGNVMCSNKEFKNFGYARALLVRDAEMDYAFSGGTMEMLRAAAVIVTTRQIQVMMPLA